jgi:hypothetical protein
LTVPINLNRNSLKKKKKKIQDRLTAIYNSKA